MSCETAPLMAKPRPSVSATASGTVRERVASGQTSRTCFATTTNFRRGHRQTSAILITFATFEWSETAP